MADLLDIEAEIEAALKGDNSNLFPIASTSSSLNRTNDALAINTGYIAPVNAVEYPEFISGSDLRLLVEQTNGPEASHLDISQLAPGFESYVPATQTQGEADDLEFPQGFDISQFEQEAGHLDLSQFGFSQFEKEAGHLDFPQFGGVAPAVGSYVPATQLAAQSPAPAAPIAQQRALRKKGRVLEDWEWAKSPISESKKKFLCRHGYEHGTSCKSKGFSTKQSLITHIVDKHDGVRFTCICGKAFPLKRNLIRHQKNCDYLGTSAVEENVCHQCGADFKDRADNLKRHLIDGCKKNPAKK